MRITRLEVRGIKLLRSVDLDFVRPDGSVRNWTVLLGENGLCKTTILQCIAAVASGTTRANRLANVVALRTALSSLEDGNRVAPRSTLNGAFEINDHVATWQAESVDVENPSGSHDLTVRLQSLLWIPEEWSEFDGGSVWLGPALAPIDMSVADAGPLGRARARNESGWFVVAYGVGRRLPTPNSTSELTDPALDRLRSLFDPTAQIVGTDFVARFDPDLARRFVDILRDILVGSGMLPNVTNIELRGRGGVRRPQDFIESHRFDQQVGAETVRIPATWLSHGYQSTIAWIADLVGQIILDGGESVDPHQYEGIVLVDEIDLHLHPLWQRTLITTLKTQFPRLQFIVTTHSPMVLTALEADEVIRLERADDGTVRVVPADAEPRFMTGTELLQHFFNIPGTFPTAVGEALHRYAQLASNPFRTDAEEETLADIIRTLHANGVDPEIPVAPRESIPESISGS